MKSIYQIAKYTFAEAVRKKYFFILTCLVLVLLWGAEAFKELHFGSGDHRFILSFAFGSITVVGTLLSVVISAQLFYEELDNRITMTFLARPLDRSEYIVGKGFGMMALILLFCIMSSVALSFSLWNADMVSMIPSVFVYGFTQWIELSMVSSMSLLMCVLGQSGIFATIVSFLLVFICHFQFFIEMQIEESIGLEKMFFQFLYGVFPDFRIFNIGDRLVESAGEWSVSLLYWPAGYGFFYVGVFLALAVGVFTHREL